ncbi:MAG: flagellar assembly protein FliW [Synergistaceae bacterium]|nr:flagellar assembly protein FliW [Synergistaceae bacterium]
MISLTSTRFGEMEVDEGDIINFPAGIPGFEDKHSWILVGDEDNAIMWLHSIDDGSLALPVTTPESIKGDYNAKLPRESLEQIGELDIKDIILLIVVAIPPGRPWDMTANLRAPILVNWGSRVATQAIALNEDYDFRFPVLDAAARESMKAKSPAAEASEKEN